MLLEGFSTAVRMVSLQLTIESAQQLPPAFIAAEGPYLNDRPQLTHCSRLTFSY